MSRLVYWATYLRETSTVMKAYSRASQATEVSSATAITPFRALARESPSFLIAPRTLIPVVYSATTKASTMKIRPTSATAETSSSMLS